MKAFKTKTGLLFGIALVCFLAANASAQVTWLRNYYGKGAALEYGNARGEGFDSDYASGYSLLLSVHNTLNPAMQLIAQLPIAHGSVHLLGESSSSFVVGNFYVGLEGKDPDQSSTVFRAGIRLPLAPDGTGTNGLALAYGSAINNEQFEAYFPKMLAFHTSFGYQFIGGNENSPNRTLFSITGGGAFMKPKGYDGEFFGDADVQGWYEGRKVRVGLGAILRYDITEDNVDNRFNILSGATVVGVFGSFTPQVSIHVPMTEDLTQIVDFTYSISLGYDIR